MTDKRTIIDLIPGQQYELRSPRGIRVSYPVGKPKGGDPLAVLGRDIGVWVEPPPPVEPPPIEPPPPTTTLVSSIVGLLAALDDNTVTDITVRNGTYQVATAASQQSNSLWIGSRFADRSQPVTVHAETKGGVIFDGGGTRGFGGISFEAGVHDQTWDGFVWANGSPANSAGTDGTGVVMFNGYAGQPGVHHITLRNCTVRPGPGSTPPHGHAVYFSWAVGGPHDIVIDNMTIDDPNHAIIAGWHFFHSDAANPNAHDVTIRNSSIVGTQQGVMLWDTTVRNILFEDVRIDRATDYGVRYERAEADNAVTLRRVVTTNSGSKGFYSGAGTNPPGITFEQCSFG